MRVCFIIVLCFVHSLSEEVLRVSAGDSYLEAYKESISAPSSIAEKNAEKKSDGGYPVYPGPAAPYGPPDSFGPSSPDAASQYGPPNPQYGPAVSQYGPPIPQNGPQAPQYGPPIPQNGPPAPQYVSPSPQYGSPAPQYGPAAPQYGPPAGPQYGSPPPQYGPPAPQYGQPPVTPPSYGTFMEPIPQYGPPVYGPPAQNLQVFYGMPHAMISIWDKLWEKLKWKLNIFTLGKIILKLVIFKKIVSLIAIICLLLFIPSLKHKKLGFLSSHGEDEGERSIKTGTPMSDTDSLNTLSAYAIEAIENYTNTDRKHAASCDTTYCRVRKSVKKLDQRIPYDKLATLYANESR